MGNQKGMIMVLGLLLLTVLTIIGMGAVGTMIFDTKIGANYDAANQAFYSADAGLEDARSRLNKKESSSPIVDTDQNNPDWVLVIGTPERAAEKGLSSALRMDQLEPSLGYVVVIKHKVNSSDQVLKWGDSNYDGVSEENTTFGGNIYVITSEGFGKENSRKSLKMEVATPPPLNIPGAVYTRSNTAIKGSSTMITGSDGCGTGGKPGIVSMGTISTSGNPVISGNPTDLVENSTQNIDADEIVYSLKDYATHTYDVPGGTQMSGTNWGTPYIISPNLPSTCSTHNIVYFDAHGSTVKLTGGSSGCGILIVDGSLEANGGFSWNGIILTTGSVTMKGGGEKNVTGAILAGSTVADDEFGGNISIIYCSTAIESQANDLPPLLLNWMELF